MKTFRLVNGDKKELTGGELIEGKTYTVVTDAEGNFKHLADKDGKIVADFAPMDGFVVGNNRTA